MIQQRTLAEKVGCTGLGIHSGLPVRLNLLPARVDTGVRFVRLDGDARHETAAHADAVSATALATTLGSGPGSIATVEHLLATLSAFGVTNACIEVDGPELPVMDGSAASFVHMVRSAGVVDQVVAQPVLQVKRPIEISEPDRKIRVEPARHLSLDVRIDFDHPVIGVQCLSIDRLGGAVFESEIARARTFGFLADVDAMRAAGFARGGSLANTLVLDETSVLNPGGLRYPDEFVRHKTLDLIGDLALLGFPLRGRVVVDCGGHALHHRLVQALLRERDAWTLRDDIAGRGRARLEAPVQLVTA
ncbi:MAG: UDP-3-O-acyl-N-acetylglucosamine deacetylase [Myxococcota bacterium]|nr:UDP-3-O-acyl-N-acetylglucosamine deacetylase [Myxococcota bacterium]